MATLLETLSSYVPVLVRRHLAADPGPIAEPTAERFPAAALFADIAGFTELAEKLAQRGPVGAEALSRMLNAYFGQLIALITAHGGDVVKFAGDALLAIWSARAEDPAADPTQALALAALRAAQCGLAVQVELHDYPVTGNEQLSLRVGVGTGNVFAVHLGGMYGRWELLVAGPPLIQAGRAEEQAYPGAVVLSQEAWQLVQERCVGSRLPTEDVRVRVVREPLALRPLNLTPLPLGAEKALRAYIPAAIRSRLDAGQTGWLAELRPVTVLFVNLPDLNYTTALEQAQATMRALQTALYRYEGSVNKLNVDDKGTTLVCALGLPPLAHEDDAARGVQAAQAMQAQLQALGLRSAIGVTTGRAFCGSVGSDARREYTMIGDVVNLAARLMQAAGDDILCDQATYQAAQTCVLFEALPEIQVKGKAEPVAICRPCGETMRRSTRARGAMVGREVERERLIEGLRGLEKGANGVVVIEGEAGIGKSRLVEYLLGQAEEFAVRCFLGWGDAVEKTTPYFAWRSVLAELFDLDLLVDPPEVQRERVLARLERGSVPLELAPLLEAVLPLDLADNDLTAHMSGEARANKTRDLLLALLQEAASVCPLLLVLEDGHWLDSASWALVRLVYREVRPVLLVIATRPISEPVPVEYERLLDDPDLVHLVLGALPPDETLDLVCARLGVPELPEPVSALICEQAEGHPFFSEELAYALRDAGLIHVIDGACRIDSGAGDLRALDFPDTIQGIITSRIDRLTPQQQLTLKVASVIGRVFAFRVLRDVHPIEEDRSHLADYLGALEQLDITPMETPDPDLAYIFKHIITQEVTYSLMAFAQRRRLHQAVAEWYERFYADDLTSFYPLLAHHWGQAAMGRTTVSGPLAESGPASKAIEYLEKAGELALRGNANREAISFFGTLLDWEEEDRATGVSPLRRARWDRQLGEAHYGLGQLEESRERLERALARLGRPIPVTGVGLAVGLLGQALRQALHRLWPASARTYPPAAGAEILEAVQACERLGAVYYQGNESILTMYAGLRALNLAERVEPSPVLARAYAFMCIVAGLVPWHALAETYSRRAREIAQEVDDLPTLARVLEVMGLYALGVGQWEKAQDSLERAADLNERLGNRREWDESTALLAWAHYFQGHLVQSTDLWGDVATSARRGEDPWSQVWGLCGQVEGRLPRERSRLDQLVSLLKEAEALLSEKVSYPERIRVYGLLARVYQWAGEPRLAQQAAEAAAHWIAQTSPTTPYSFEGYAGAAKACLRLWEGGGDRPPAERDALAKSARRACRALREFARVFPIARPRAWLWQGGYEWLAGRQRRARDAWRKSLLHAERLAMPYEQGLAHYEIGRHLPADDPARHEHLSQAADILARLDAA